MGFDQAVKWSVLSWIRARCLTTPLGLDFYATSWKIRGSFQDLWKVTHPTSKDYICISSIHKMCSTIDFLLKTELTADCIALKLLRANYDFGSRTLISYPRPSSWETWGIILR